MWKGKVEEKSGKWGKKGKGGREGKGRDGKWFGESRARNNLRRLKSAGLASREYLAGAWGGESA
jgi:hypothetical protein